MKRSTSPRFDFGGIAPGFHSLRQAVIFCSSEIDWEEEEERRGEEENKKQRRRRQAIHQTMWIVSQHHLMTALNG